jgi:uncharacterized membrane protein
MNLLGTVPNLLEFALFRKHIICMVTDNQVAWEKHQREKTSMNKEELSECLKVLDVACASHSEYSMQKEEEIKVKLEMKQKLDKVGNMHMQSVMHRLDSTAYSKREYLSCKF